MTVSAAAFFGFRAVVGLVIATTAAIGVYMLLTTAARMLDWRQSATSILHVTALGCLTGLCLPSSFSPTAHLLAGTLLGVTTAAINLLAWVRLHPVAVVMVLVWCLPSLVMGPESADGGGHAVRADNVLRPNRVFIGDVSRGADRLEPEAWWSVSMVGQDAVHRMEPDRLVMRERHRIFTHAPMLTHMLSSGELARMEEVLLGCVPGSMGGTSRGLLIALGLYMAYRRLTWWPLPCLTLAAMLATLLIMPVSAEGGTRLVAGSLLMLPPAVAVTAVAFVVFASPLLLIALILAPLSMPLTRTGRAVYALGLGAAGMSFVWLTGIPEAAFLGLLLLSAAGPWLDRLHRSPFVT